MVVLLFTTKIILPFVAIKVGGVGVCAQLDFFRNQNTANFFAGGKYQQKLKMSL